MADHIYGRHSSALHDRPPVFLNELQLYVDYLKNLVKNSADDVKKIKVVKKFNNQLIQGISYYRTIIDEMEQFGFEKRQHFLSALNNYEIQLQQIKD